MQLAKKVAQNPIFFLAFGFGAGLIPFAPGTFGTIAAIPIYLLLLSLPLVWYIIVVFVLFIIGIFICQTVTNEIKIHDHQGIVWDEIVGYLITMIHVPFQAKWMIIGFILFRIFDIWKPQPIRYIDKHVTGGLGIMIDDLIAAVPAWCILQGLIWIFPS